MPYNYTPLQVYPIIINSLWYKPFEKLSWGIVRLLSRILKIKRFNKLHMTNRYEIVIFNTIKILGN